MPTLLDSPAATGRAIKKDQRVRITANTLLTREGRGVPLYVGSVLDVFEEEAAILVSCKKAEKVGNDVLIKLVPSPFTTQPPLKKVS
jgi:hypothetical protein